MKKAKIVLATIAIMGALGGAFAAKAKAIFGGVNYYTTLVSNAIATATLTSGKTTVSTAPGATHVYYTTIDNARATALGYLTKTAS